MKQMKKPTRTISGVTPVTIFTKPYKCSGNCIFCPNEQDSPKSYLKNEPGIQRAYALKYDPYIQVQHRINTYIDNKHNVDKIEIIISGGTWDDYPLNYQKWYIKRVFQALNSQFNKYKEQEIENEKLTKFTEIFALQKINSLAKCRCIGMSIETRPDKINIDSLTNYRKFGITKVQIGIQTTSNKLLKLNNRGHKLATTKEAINLLRVNGFKIQAHWMCNLFGATPETDIKDYYNLFNDSDLKPDELKIYPCTLLENTALFRLYKNKKYAPYPYSTLVDLLKKCKLMTPKYSRISRLFRDIPSEYIVAGNKRSNIREDLQKSLFQENKSCKCIRCREIREYSSRIILKPYIKTEKYETSVSTEYFIQSLIRVDIKSKKVMQDLNNEKLIGFLRLSIYKTQSKKTFYQQIEKFDAMIRELHVYGKSVALGEDPEANQQHKGIGKILIKEAENIVEQSINKPPNKKIKFGVIASVGTREYYKKFGFEILEESGYGLKNLQ